MKKIIFCYTVPSTFIFTTDIITILKDKGYKVILMSSNEQELMEVAKSLNVDFVFFDFTREFSIYRDLATLIKMINLLRKLKPEIVIGATPKSALISMMASKFVGVNHRIYHILGLPYETATGIKKTILLLVEKLTSFCATRIVPISSSVSKEYEIKFKFTKNIFHNIGLLSIAGVDLKKFDNNRFVFIKDQIKKDIGIQNNYFIIGFVGRLTVDKGVGDFIALWNGIKKKYDKVAVMIIGDTDSRDGFDQNLLNVFFEDQNVFHFAKTNEVEKYMSIMDVFVLPSYREGFGNVIIEASSMKVPVVSYNVTGCKDSVKDGFSGILVEKNNINSLISAVSYFIDYPSEKEKFGDQGRSYVEKYFSRYNIALNFVKFINNLK